MRFQNHILSIYAAVIFIGSNASAQQPLVNIPVANAVDKDESHFEVNNSAKTSAQPQASPSPNPETTDFKWHFGGFVDVGYLLDFNHPANQIFRSRGSENPGKPIAVDLVTSSGSGLDPHISPAAAEFQVPRVARKREIDENELRQLITNHTSGRTFGFLGEARVNVLELNLELDERKPMPK